MFSAFPLFGNRPRVDGLGARFGHLLEDFPLVFGIAFDGLDQIGNQVIPPSQLDIHLRPGVVRTVPQRDQAVVDTYTGNDNYADDDKDNH